jgi:hypothetical protein
VPRRASQRLIGQWIWIFFVLVLVAGLGGLVTPVAVWVAAIPIPLALLLLTPARGVRRQRSIRAGTRPGRRDPERGS